jgi:YfiH family protein
VLIRDPQRIYRAAGWESAYPWIEHGFGTRLSRDWPPQPTAWVKQIHSKDVVVAEYAGLLGRADALISNTPDLWLSVRTADCIPILLVDPKRRAVAAVHAGWRGAAESIAAEAVREMARRFGSDPRDMAAAIGPGVCGECYQVGAEVAGRFRPWFPERGDLDRETTVDLPEANRRQLVEAGLDPGRVVSGAPCTVSNPDEFHSYRRTRSRTGRMISAIRIRPE